MIASVTCSEVFLFAPHPLADPGRALASANPGRVLSFGAPRVFCARGFTIAATAPPRRFYRRRPRRMAGK